MFKVEVKQEEEEEIEDCSITVKEEWQPEEVEKEEDEALDADMAPPPIEFVGLPASTLTLAMELNAEEPGPSESQSSSRSQSMEMPIANGEIHKQSDDVLLVNLITYARKKKNLSFQCLLCEQNFVSKKGLNRHMQYHIKKGRNSDPCKHCTKRFRNATALKVHLRRCEKERGPFICDLCGKAFEHSCALAVHRKFFHCQVCSVVFESQVIRRAHEKQQHVKIPCGHCKRRFSTNEELQDHMNAIQGSSTHSCYFCGMSFLFKSKVLKHLKKCPVKSFPCDQCEEKFRTSSALHNHRQLIHQSERLYECVACPKVFDNRNEHEVHLRMHTDLKPLYCKMCTRWFLYQRIFNAHQTKCHVG